MANPTCGGGDASPNSTTCIRNARMHNNVIHDAECDCVLCTWISYQNFDPEKLEIKGMQKVFGARCKYERPPRSKTGTTVNRQVSHAAQTCQKELPAANDFAERYTVEPVPVNVTDDEDSNLPIDLSTYSSRSCHSSGSHAHHLHHGLNSTEPGLLPGQRIRFTPSQLKCLKDNYFQSKRPTKDDMQQIASDLGVKERSVKNWFKNRRAQERNRERNDQSDLI